MGLLCLLHAAKVDEGPAPGFLRRKAGADARVRMERNVGLELGGSYYRFGGAMKPYIRRMFGDAMVDRHRAMKLQLDPAFILNPDVVFDAPEAA